jgi:ferredoxin
MWLMPFHQFGHEISLSPSNFVVKVEAETCKACGLCVKRCPVDALQLKFSTKATNKFRKAAVIDPDVCIGCGVCVHKCKPKAIILEQRETTTRPPKTETDFALKYVADLQASRDKTEAP